MQRNGTVAAYGACRLRTKRRSAAGQRDCTARAIAAERAYSPMPKAPDTGTNRIRGADSLKCSEPAVEHEQIPRAAKLRADRTLEHAARHEPSDRVSQQPRIVPKPAMDGQSEA